MPGLHNLASDRGTTHVHVTWLGAGALAKHTLMAQTTLTSPCSVYLIIVCLLVYAYVYVLFFVFHK